MYMLFKCSLVARAINPHTYNMLQSIVYNCCIAHLFYMHYVFDGSGRKHKISVAINVVTVTVTISPASLP